MRRRTRLDDATFERLVREHHAAVYGSALRVLGREADAQDVAQGVFLGLLEGRITLVEPDRALPILRWHAVRAALTQRRATRRRTAREEASEEASEEAGVVRETQAPDEIIQSRDERACLWRELLALPDDQRVPLVLRFSESMTFAEIGKALSIAQPTAHERVAKGLDRLRVRLSGLGFAALANGLEEQLQTCPAPPVPPGLEAHLLGLHGAAHAAATGGAFALGAWALGGALVAAAAWSAVRGMRDDASGAPPALALAGPDAAVAVPIIDPPAEPAQRRPLAPSALAPAIQDASPAPAAAPELHGWLTGHVADEDGAPLADQALRVSSLERAGKFPTWSAPGHTDVNGAFRIRVELPDTNGRTVRLVSTEPHSHELASSVRVLPDRTSDLGRLQLELEAPGAVDAVDEPAPPAAGSLTGRVVSVYGQAPRWIQVFVPAGSRWINAEYEPETGRFELPGLTPGKHVLRVQPQGWMDWSPVELSVEIPASDLLVTLKRASDPRDIGDHDAELHGRLLDAATGAPIACTPGEGVEVFWAPDAPGGDLERDFLPNHQWPSPRQTSAIPDTGVDPYRVPAASSEFHSVGLRAGTYLVHHYQPGRARGVLGPFKLGEREVRAGLEVRMQVAATARVHVVDPAGQPVEGAWVFFTGTGPYSDERVADLDAAFRKVDGRGSFWGGGGRRTDATGSSLHEHLPAGAHLRVAVIHPGYEPLLGPLLELEPGARSEPAALRLTRPR